MRCARERSSSSFCRLRKLLGGRKIALATGPFLLEIELRKLFCGRMTALAIGHSSIFGNDFEKNPETTLVPCKSTTKIALWKKVPISRAIFRPPNNFRRLLNAHVPSKTISMTKIGLVSIKQCLNVRGVALML